MARLDIVFEGGGAKGMAFAGALKVLVEEGHTWGRLVGTSAGAIAATLAAAGYGPEEILGLVQERVNGRPRLLSFFDAPRAEDFSPESKDRSVMMSVFRAVDFPVLPRSVEERLDRVLLDALLQNSRFARLFSFVEYGGFYAGRTFLAWIQEKIALKGIPPASSLQEFYRLTGIDLTMTATDVTGMELLVLNHRTAPELPVAWAVRMSMSIPFVWQEVVWRQEWGLYRGRDLTGHAIVDGGLLSNFPIWLLISADPEVTELMGPAPEEAQVLGLLIDEDQPVPGEPAAAPPLSFTSFPVICRLARLAELVLGVRDRAAIRENEHLICRLPARGYRTLEFDLAGERLERLVEAAERATRKHLEARGLVTRLAA